MRGAHAHRDLHDAVTDDAIAPDLAFADTVVSGLEEPAPASGVVLKCAGAALCVTPSTQLSLADLALPGRKPSSGLWARTRRGVRGWQAELNELWSAAASLENVDEEERVGADAPLARAATVGRRIRALFSLFEWDRADVLRAASIGLVVFILAALAGALVLRSTAHGGAPITITSTR